MNVFAQTILCFITYLKQLLFVHKREIKKRPYIKADFRSCSNMKYFDAIMLV